MVEGVLSPGLGMPLEASFFPDDGFPPLGMRLAILEVFFVESANDSRSSLGGELSLEDFPDLLLSSLSLDEAMDLLPLAEPFENEEEGEEEEEVLLDALREDVGVFVGICLAVALLLLLLHTDPMGVNPSSPYSDRSSSSCSAISATDGDVREADRGLIRRNFSSMDLWGPPPTADPTFDPSLPCGWRPSGVWGEGVDEGECVGLASMDEVALCLRFIDLLRHDLPEEGEGIAEASCCPLRLVGTVPPIPLPFIPPGTGMPLTASLSLPLAYWRGLLLSMLLKLWLRRLRLEEPRFLEAPLPAAGTLEGPGNLVFFFCGDPIPLWPGGLAYRAVRLDCISCVLRLLADDAVLLVCWLSSTRDW